MALMPMLEGREAIVAVVEGFWGGMEGKEVRLEEGFYTAR